MSDVIADLPDRVSPDAAIPTSADVVTSIALAVPGVARMATGPGVPATLLPGRRVEGVRIVPGRIEVHVVVGPHRPIPLVVTEIRVRLQELGAGLGATPGLGPTVDVVVADLDTADRSGLGRVPADAGGTIDLRHPDDSGRTRP